ncbi:protein NDNF [Sabethes cyaneus]|uniref:protein NDNF n=1 Tax=Sabethes cyaneus TaxID=53552 RepID=UPI00237DA761|nr:protein NDNF [Sabethes cyaneus]
MLCSYCFRFQTANWPQKKNKTKMKSRIEVLHVALLMLLVCSQTTMIISAKTFSKDWTPGTAASSGLCPRSRGAPPQEQQLQQRAAIDEWSNTVPATILEEDKPVLMVAKESRMRYVIHLTETNPLSIVITPSCTPISGGEIRWTVVYNETTILRSHNALNRTTFQQPCASKGVYHVWVEIADTDYCAAEISYNTRSLVDLWPVLNRTSLSPIKFHQHPRKHQLLVKWEKSKFDIHAMHYCLVISRDHPQRTLCQALGNSQLNSRCSAFNMEVLQRITVEEEKKVPVDAKTTIACTGPRTKQQFRGMKSNTTYFLDVFAIHTQKNNFSYLLGSTKVHVNRTRPTQLVEGKLFVGKLSTLGGLSLFSFKVPKRSPANSTLRLLITPCGGTVNLEVYRKKRLVMKPIVDIYYPRVINVGQAIPGERYLMQISDAEEHIRINRIQIAVTTKNEFTNLPQLPANSTVAELTQLRSCQATTIAWYSSPDKRKIRYCTYIFKQHTKHQYYSNIKMPSYCELESRDIYYHPQLQQIHCIFSDQINYTELTPKSMSITDLAPAHYYLIFVTASLGNGRSIPYRLARVKTHPFCHENEASLSHQQQHQQLRTVSAAKKQQPHAVRGNSTINLLKSGGPKQKRLTERRNNRLRRHNK